MKRTVFVTLLLYALPIVSFAQRGILLGPPHDDPNVRRDVYSRVELKPFITEYDHIIKTRVGALKGENIAKVFGPKLEHRSPVSARWYPTNSVAPSFAPYSLSFSGLLAGEDQSHRDLYAMGNVGYVEFFYERDNRLKTAVIYLRLDDQFVSLKSTNDLSKRLEWDKAKFEVVKKWLDEHLVPIENAKKGSPDAAENPTK
ncbi:MAG: hypothetical protein AAB370_07745 [Verrucomicrobiota bacterium]